MVEPNPSPPKLHSTCRGKRKLGNFAIVYKCHACHRLCLVRLDCRTCLGCSIWVSSHHAWHRLSPTPKKNFERRSCIGCRGWLHSIKTWSSSDISCHIFRCCHHYLFMELFLEDNVSFEETKEWGHSFPWWSMSKFEREYVCRSKGHACTSADCSPSYVWRFDECNKSERSRNITGLF